MTDMKFFKSKRVKMLLLANRNEDPCHVYYGDSQFWDGPYSPGRGLKTFTLERS